MLILCADGFQNTEFLQMLDCGAIDGLADDNDSHGKGHDCGEEEAESHAGLKGPVRLCLP